MDVLNTQLIPAFKVLETLMDVGNLRPDVKQAVFVNHARFKPEVQAFERVRIDTIRQHAEKDEEGQMITENDRPVFADDETEAVAQADLDTLLENSVEITVQRMDVGALFACNRVTARDISKIDFMLSGDEELLSVIDDME